jgi:peptidoglycan hydrolase-like protein with peptidoglycan-binding domain
VGIIFSNPAGGDTSHITTAQPLSSVINNTLLLYDRLFAVAKTMNSTATEAVTGVPTRYQSVTSTDQDYAGGNFLFPETGTALPATAHNWTVCQYTDQDGNAAANLPSLAGNASNIINRLDTPAGYFFAPLAAGDIGVKVLTQMQCSALVATGAIDFVIGHPLMWMPCPIANMACTVDGIGTAFNLVRIFDSACLGMLEVCKPATTATTYSGTVSIAQG